MGNCFEDSYGFYAIPIIRPPPTDSLVACVVVRARSKHSALHQYYCGVFCLFEIYLFRVTRSSVINSCFSTRPWLNNTTTIHAWTTVEIHNVLI